MTASAKAWSDERVYNPASMGEGQFDRAPEAWRDLVQLDRPLEGVDICSISGRPGSSWTFRSEGDLALSMSILLEGRVEAVLDGGPSFSLEGGQALLLAVERGVSGWNRLSAVRGFHLVNIHVMHHALPGLSGLTLEELRGLLPACSAPAPCHAFMQMMPALSTLQRVAGEISHCRYVEPRTRRVFLCSKVIEALAVMLDSCSHEADIQPSRCSISADRSRLMRARRLLEQRYDEAWSVRLLTRTVGLNEKRLQTGFRALYGCTAHECLTRIRLERALTLLMAGHSVTDTAQAVGFSNISHFSKVFRHSIGLSPRHWLHAHESASTGCLRESIKK